MRDSRFRHILAADNDAVTALREAAENARSLLDALPSTSPYHLVLKRVAKRIEFVKELNKDVEQLQMLARMEEGGPA